MKQLPMFDAIEVSMTKGYTALIDPVDADLLEFSWQYHPTGYAVRGHKINRVSHITRMHRMIYERILGHPLKHSEQVDHIDGNKLNNRRSNLRLCTSFGNNQNKGLTAKNTSGYKGVSWNKRDRKWYSTIAANYKTIHLGAFNTAQEAHEAYCKAALKYHGEFARFE